MRITVIRINSDKYQQEYKYNGNSKGLVQCSVSVNKQYVYDLTYPNNPNYSNNPNYPNYPNKPNYSNKTNNPNYLNNSNYPNYF